MQTRAFSGGLWHHRDFLRLWSAQTVSMFGSYITGTALPFTAVLVLDVTPLQMAFLAAAGIAPALIAGVAAGVWVDRLPRRPVMIVADLGRATLLLSVPVAWAMDALVIEHLYVVAFTTGVLTIAFDVAYQAYLPAIVERENLIEGNSKLAASSSVAEFSGFGISGWLVQLLNGPLAVLIDAVTFVISAGFVRSIRRPEPARPHVEARPGFIREARAGFATAARSPVLRSIGGATVLYSIGFGGFGAAFMLFVTKELGFQPGVLGLIFALGGLSSLAGALAAGRASSRLGVGPAMVAGVGLMGASMFCIPAATSAGVVGGMLLIAQQLGGDGAFTVYDVNEVSLRQSITQDEMLGRVNSIMRILADGSRLGGALLGGVLGEIVGLRFALVIAAGCTVASAVWLASSPVLAIRRTPVVAIPATTPAEA
jgi:MFS family permease